MNTEIGTFDAAKRTVGVTFTYDGVAHSRVVNACLDAGGQYDAAATAERIADVAADVAAGVAVKITSGAIKNPEPEGWIAPPTAEHIEVESAPHPDPAAEA